MFLCACVCVSTRACMCVCVCVTKSFRRWMSQFASRCEYANTYIYHTHTHTHTRTHTHTHKHTHTHTHTFAFDVKFQLLCYQNPSSSRNCLPAISSLGDAAYLYPNIQEDCAVHHARHTQDNCRRVRKEEEQG